MNPILAQAVVCLAASIAPSGAAHALSEKFFAGELCRQRRSEPGLGSADRRHRRQFLSRGGRAVDPFGAAPGQAFAAAAQCLYRLGAEQPQPWRRDDRSEAADRLLQRSLSRNLRPRTFGPCARHDRAAIAAAQARARHARLQHRGFLRACRQAGGPDHRAAHGQVGSGQIFRVAQWRFDRDARGLQRTARAVAAARHHQAVPGIGARPRAGLRGRQEHRGRPLHLRQSRLRALLAVLPRPHRRPARR